MSDVDLSIRIRAILEQWLLVIIIVLLIVTLGLGWWTYQVNAVTEFETEERMVDEWSETTDFNHSAIVVNETRVWDVGERISNRPLYYTRASPELDGTYTYTYRAENGEVRVATETYLLIRAVDNADGGNVFWEVAEPLDSETTDSLAPNEVHRIDFAVNTTTVVETVGEIETELDATEGLVDVRVIAESNVEGTVQDDVVDRTYRSEFPMVVSQNTYRVDEVETMDEQHQTVEHVDVVVRPPASEAYGSLALFAVAAGLLVTIVVGGYTGRIECTEEERELLEIERQRERFAEWITTGSIPTRTKYDTTIMVNDLEGLVDVAIDTNKRVIEDRELGVSSVLDEDVIYMYIRPDSPARDWLSSQADATLGDTSYSNE